MLRSSSAGCVGKEEEMECGVEKVGEGKRRRGEEETLVIGKREHKGREIDYENYIPRRHRHEKTHPEHYYECVHCKKSHLKGHVKKGWMCNEIIEVDHCGLCNYLLGV